MLLVLTSLKAEKEPPITILLSCCTAKPYMVLFGDTEKPVQIFVIKDVSKVPSLFNKAILLIGTPLKEVNCPYTAIFPSGLTIMSTGGPLNHVPMLVANVVSKTPSVLNLAILPEDIVIPSGFV